MSLLSSFLTKNLLSALESEFMAHEPELQQQLLSEVKIFADEVGNWINEKINASVVDPAQ